MIVTLDTNIFVQNFTLKSDNFQTFLGGLKLISAKLYISKVVIDEILNKYQQQLASTATKQRLGYKVL